MVSPLTHLEEFGNVTSRELWCKYMEQQTDALPVKAMDKSMCQGVGNGLKTSLTKRNSQVNHVSGLQVSTTPRRARNPDEEHEMRTIRPHLDTSALIKELCERDAPEIDGEKLAMDNSSVYDIHFTEKTRSSEVETGGPSSQR